MPHYGLNEPTAVYEDFGTDAVVLNLMSGAYFSLSNRTKVFFEGVASGLDPADLISKLSETDAAQAKGADAVLKTILENELIVLREDVQHTKTVEQTVEEILSQDGDFGIDSYSDLSDVIAADPIHDL